MNKAVMYSKNITQKICYLCSQFQYIYHHTLLLTLNVSFPKIATQYSMNWRLKIYFEAGTAF